MRGVQKTIILGNIKGSNSDKQGFCGGLGHLFERTFVRIAEKSNKCPFEQMSSNFFGNFLEALIEALEPQKWQTTHWKAYCKSIRMETNHM